MCRFVAYLGKPRLLKTLISDGPNCLIQQSTNAQEMSHPLNGDGFGLGWYDLNIDPIPGTFTSIQPAWNDSNLISLSRKIQSSCFFAHVRAANVGSVAKHNCQPFCYDNLLFMHNGYVPDFQKIKRLLRRELDDHSYDWIRGQTDSEHLCALFGYFLKQTNSGDSLNQFATAFNSMLTELAALQTGLTQELATLANITITDGKQLIACRYSNKPEQQINSLHYTKTDDDSVIIASEKFNEDVYQWQEVPANHFLTVDTEHNTTLTPILLDVKARLY